MRILVSLSKKPKKKRIRKQSGVIPYRIKDGKLQIMLIKSRHANNWGIPKGKIENNLGIKRSALTEAWEEAGLRGVIGPKLGSYVYIKGYTDVKQHVTVYEMAVDKAHKQFPEASFRTRKWLSIKDALKVLPKKHHKFINALKRRKGTRHK